MALTILVLGVIFLIIIYSENEEKIQLKNDEWLLLRRQEVGLSTWRELRQKARIERLTLRYLRKNEVKKLTLLQLTQLATALNWTPEELLKKLGLLHNQEEILLNECKRLRTQLEEQSSELNQENREFIFGQLQTLLINYPTLKQMVKVKPDLPTKNIISLFNPLDNLISTWGYETIGQVWQEVEYSPSLHQADSSEIQPGDPVYIRFVGYRDGLKIICPAKVSRTLPGGAA